MATTSPATKPRGFTLIEFVAFFFFLTILAIVLFPLFAKAKSRSNRSYAPMQRQGAQAFLQYIQDYDGRFPPVGYMRIVHATSETQRTAYPVSWGPDYTAGNGTLIAGLIAPYAKNNALFIDPVEMHSTRYDASRTFHLTYMYNDLLATHRQSDVAQTDRTVLMTDAEDRFANFGHAYSPDSGPFVGEFNSEGRCDPGRGATVRDAATRFAGG